MEVRQIPWGGMEYAKMIALRNELLCLPVGGCVFGADLRAEKDYYSFLAYDDAGEAVGTLLLMPESETQVHVRQVATLPRVRGQGYGHALMAAAEAFAREKGFVRMVLDSRQGAKHFYAACGFADCGEDFGRPDLRLTPMEKRID